MSIDRWLAFKAARLAAPIAVAALAAGCGGGAEGGDTTELAAADAEFARVINVEVAVVEPTEFVERISLTGTAMANRDVSVSAEQTGRIRSVYVEKGSRVGAGQAIAKIVDDGIRAQVAQAEAAAALARETWERRKRLYEEDRVGSELAYLEARYTAEQADAALRALQDQLAKTVIRAPFAGVLDDRMVEVGTMVSPGAAVARVIDLSPAKINAGVPERYALSIRPGAPVEVTFAALEGRRFEGTISYVGAAVNPSNRTFPVELEVPNEDGTIKPEMVADVRIVRGTVPEALVVPQEALVRVEDGYVVFVVAQEDGRAIARRRAIERGPAQRDQVVVRSGLSAGDRVVVVGQQQVADGDRVRVVES